LSAIAAALIHVHAFQKPSKQGFMIGQVRFSVRSRVCSQKAVHYAATLEARSSNLSNRRRDGPPAVCRIALNLVSAFLPELARRNRVDPGAMVILEGGIFEPDCFRSSNSISQRLSCWIKRAPWSDQPSNPRFCRHRSS
jgi:hypothetical protein